MKSFIAASMLVLLSSTAYAGDYKQGFAYGTAPGNGSNSTKHYNYGEIARQNALGRRLGDGLTQNTNTTIGNYISNQIGGNGNNVVIDGSNSGPVTGTQQNAGKGITNALGK